MVTADELSLPFPHDGGYSATHTYGSDPLLILTAMILELTGEDKSKPKGS